MSHTLDDFRTRFPAFDDTATDDEVELALSDAGLVVDDTWLEGDVDPATLYLAAHYLTEALAAAEQTEDGETGTVQSESIGRISVTYASVDRSPDRSDYASTRYGVRFEEYRIRNRNHGVII